MTTPPPPPPMVSASPTPSNTQPHLQSNLLYKIESVFPFDLFPDRVFIARDKIDIIYREFFRTRQVFSIPIIDLRIIHLSKTIFFSSLYFELAGYEQNPPHVRFLPNSEAATAKNIITGLILAQKMGKDLSGLDNEEAKEYLYNLGNPTETTINQQ